MTMRIPDDELQHEVDHLEETIAAIDAETAKIEQQSPATAATSETANLIQENLQKRLEDLSTMRPEPYIGRIVFKASSESDAQSIYIGRGHIEDVYNWEAPIARLFYQPTAGRYVVDGQERSAQVTLKRGIRITDSRLDAVSDVLRLAPPPEVAALPEGLEDMDAEKGAGSHDLLLDDRLGVTGRRDLTDIVATIQPEQYALIAEADCKVMIVQGAAGSGKSEIGQQRLAWLLAPNNGLAERDRPQASRVLLIGPSLAFLHYVRNLLPKLGVQPIEQSTLREWLLQRFSQRVRLGQNNRLFQDLMSNHPKFTKDAFEAERFKGSLEMKRVIDRYVRRQQGQLHGNFVDEYLRMVANDSALIARGVTASRPLMDTDLAPMLYFDHLLNGHAPPQYEHIVIDEAQDVSPLEVHLLLMHSRNGWFTILGDLRQRLTPYRGVSNWQEMRRVFPPEESRRFDARHSYRSTAQITRLGNRILQRLPEQGGQPPIPHAREGTQPKLHRSPSVREMYAAIADQAVEGLANDQTVAVLTRTSWDAEDALKRLREQEIDEAQVLKTNDVIESDLIVCPILLSKGLEFDLVIIAGVDAARFTGSEMDNRLLYLATTRARHRLEIHWVGKPSPLIEGLGAVGMEVAGNLDTSRGKRGVFDRSRPRRRGHRIRGQPRR